MCLGEELIIKNSTKLVYVCRGLSWVVTLVTVDLQLDFLISIKTSSSSKVSSSDASIWAFTYFRPIFWDWLAVDIVAQVSAALTSMKSHVVRLGSYVNGKKGNVCVCVCVCVCMCVYLREYVVGSWWDSFQPSTEHRTPFNATLNAIHMLIAPHLTFDTHTYMYVHNDSNYPTKWLQYYIHIMVVSCSNNFL